MLVALVAALVVAVGAATAATLLLGSGSDEAVADRADAPAVSVATVDATAPATRAATAAGAAVEPTATPAAPPPSVRARVARTCGADGSADCFVSVRSSPSSDGTELRRLDEGTVVRASCQERGLSAYSSVLGDSSTLWTRLRGGGYVATVYLDGEEIDPGGRTLPPCR